jgi:hypothetical protein
MKWVIWFALPMLLAPVLFLASASPAFADRGMIPVSDVSVYGPGQKAIIAWNGEEEILILSTDVYAGGDTAVLELIPLPAEPQGIAAGDFDSFVRIEELMTQHFPYSWWDRTDAPLADKGEGIEIVFHQKIGAHDITVVRAVEVMELIQWAEEFLEDHGMAQKISSPKLESVAGDYIEEGFEFFVFDLIEVTSNPRSIEPIIYRFETDFLYYPLVISSLASGETKISLFLLTPGVINFAELPKGMTIGLSYGQPVQFEINGEELRSIYSEIAELLGDSAWLTAVQYDGDLKDLESDLKLYGVRTIPELTFHFLNGSCAAEGESTATISLWNDKVLFYGSVIAPTPCHELEAELVISTTPIYPPRIIVDITAEDGDTICIQCIGEIDFSGEIENLGPGEYDILIFYEGRIIAQQRIEIQPSGSPSIPGYILQVLLEQEIQRLELTAVDGKAVYVVEGVAEARLFWLIPIHMEIKTTIDAQWGEVLQEEMPWWSFFCKLPPRGMSE